jgi:hypothetical protein
VRLWLHDLGTAVSDWSWRDPPPVIPDGHVGGVLGAHVESAAPLLGVVALAVLLIGCVCLPLVMSRRR